MAEQQEDPLVDPLIYVPLRLVKSVIDRVEQIAYDCRTNRSEVIRLALDRGLDKADDELHIAAAAEARQRAAAAAEAAAAANAEVERTAKGAP